MIQEGYFNMSKYRIVHQCDNCGKVYKDVESTMYGLCTNCGAVGMFKKMVGKRTITGWKVKPFGRIK